MYVIVSRCECIYECQPTLHSPDTPFWYIPSLSMSFSSTLPLSESILLTISSLRLYLFIELSSITHTYTYTCDCCTTFHIHSCRWKDNDASDILLNLYANSISFITSSAQLLRDYSLLLPLHTKIFAQNAPEVIKINHFIL